MTNDTPDTKADNLSDDISDHIPDALPVTTSPGEEGWTTTEIAAAVLERDKRTVKRWLKEVVDGRPAELPSEAQPIWGRKVKRGRQRPWEVDIATLQRHRDAMAARGDLQEAEAGGADAEIPAGGYEEADRAGSVQRAYETIARELAGAAERAARAETRLEITERAESSVREDLAAERRRREEAERERDELARRLEERSKGFWQRLFGG